MQPVTETGWRGGYKYQAFNVLTTGTEFAHSRRRTTTDTSSMKGFNISAIWNPVLQETLVNGVLQGRKQVDPRGASATSRSKMSETVLKIVGCLYGSTPHLEVADQQMLIDRISVKDEVLDSALKGWIRNARLS